MSIVQLPTVLPAQVGLYPATKKMVTTDSLSTIQTAGYLNQYNLEGNPVSQLDLMEVVYNYNAASNSGTVGIFTVSISNGVITLIPFTNAILKGAGTVDINTVTINAPAGIITTQTLLVGAGSNFQITFNNSYIDTNSLILLTYGAGTNTIGGVILRATDLIAGGCTIIIYNNDSVSFNGTIKVNFLVL